MKKYLLFLLCTTSFLSHSQTVGWFYSNPGSLDGYVLFAPTVSDTTYLIDKCGKRIHTWNSLFHPGLATYLLNDGTLLRCEQLPNPVFTGGGLGGVIQKFDWNSNVLWSYQISDSFQCQHHDAIQLPNGNTLAIAWEFHSGIDAATNGRINPGPQMWSEKLIEIQPVGNNSGNVVWQWRIWDHLIQDADNTELNYGNVHDHPELLDINLGVVDNSNYDWLHMNSLDYDSAHDQILLSIRNLDEIFIIDHSTTLAEAATHSGGNSGHGGDILYRWGNPQNYMRGTANDQKFFQQHNATWIKQGLPGAGKIMVFNNGVGRPDSAYSTIETFTPPALDGGSFPIDPDSAFKPHAQDWIYAADPATSLLSLVEGGAQRLSNGNTMICEAVDGRFFEIDSFGNNMWKYVSPVGATGLVSQGQIAPLNSCFRVTFIPSQYPGLAGQSLIPGAPLELNPNNYTCYSFATGDGEINFDHTNLACYPNPFRNNFAIHVSAEVSNATLQVHDVTGRLLYEKEKISVTPQDEISVSLNHYKGMVIISLHNEEGSIAWNTTAIAQ